MLERGSPGQLEVRADGHTLYKKRGGFLSRLFFAGWPDPDAVIAAIEKQQAALR